MVRVLIGTPRFLFLHRNFNYASRVLSIATKVTINQICFTPIFNTYFFGMQSFLAGDGFDAIVDRIRRAVPTSIVNSCKLWPAVTAFSFAVVPVEYRPVFAGVIAVGWQTYLSYLNRVAEDAARLAGLAAGAGAGATEQQEQQHDKSTTAAPLSP